MNYKELANALQQPGPGTEAFYKACDEAAAILRRLDAAQADVDGVMALVDEHGSYRWGTGFNEGIGASRKSEDNQAVKARDKLRTSVEALALQATPAPKEPT